LQIFDETASFYFDSNMQAAGLDPSNELLLNNFQFTVRQVLYSPFEILPGCTRQGVRKQPCFCACLHATS
jgi:hypothetical protein